VNVQLNISFTAAPELVCFTPSPLYLQNKSHRFPLLGVWVELEISADKTMYMVMSRDQNAGRNHSVRINNNTFERMEEFKYLGTTLTHQNSIPEEIKRRVRSGNACYHSVQNRLSSRLLSKNLKIKLYRTIILPVVLYGCETWSLTLREERKLRVFESMVLRRIFGPRRDEVRGNEGDCITRN